MIYFIWNYNYFFRQSHGPLKKFTTIELFFHPINQLFQGVYFAGKACEMGTWTDSNNATVTNTTTSHCEKGLPIPLLLSNCLDLKPAAELTVAKLMDVVEKAIDPNSFLLLPVDISSGPSRCSELPVHCPPARTMDCTRSFMAGMQMKANESAWFNVLNCFLHFKCLTFI